MASENAKAVAREVIEKVRTGQKVNFSEIQKKHGYSKISASSMKAKKTKTFQLEIKPVVDQMIEERQRAINHLKGKISKAKYRDLVDGVDKLTRNVQLLTGGDTEKVTYQITGMKIT